jgi:hypothetical protein
MTGDRHMLGESIVPQERIRELERVLRLHLLAYFS